jgi:predicted nucleic acid-binding protein
LGLLIDSTVLIHAERRHQTPAELVAELMERWEDPELAISVMSAAELFHGCWRAESPSRRASREEFVEAILGAVPVVPITLAMARIFGEIDARLTASGSRLPTSDLLIAATALSQGDEIVTGNPRHFHRVGGLKVYVLE